MPALGTLGGASQFGFGRSAKITIQRPVITLDTGYSGSESSTITRPRFTSSAFVFSNGVPSTAHASSDWQFSTTSDFSSTLSPQTISTSTTNKTSYTITTKFAYTTLIYARVRYRDNANPANVSDWSVPITFTTQPQPAIFTPSILSPTESQFLPTRTIFISTSNFGVSNNEDNETHVSTTYQVSEVSDFSTTLYNVTSTTSLTSITTPDVGGGTKYIRVKHNGSGGIAISNWSSTRVVTVAWADSGAGVGTFYPNSDTFVVTSSKSVTLSPGNYRVNLYGGGGGAAAAGGNTRRRGGYAGCVQRDVYISTPSSLSFTIATGGGAATGDADNSTAVAGAGGFPGGGSGGGGASNRWCGGGGGGYSTVTFPGGATMTAAGGGGAASDGISNGRSARRGRETEWYGDSFSGVKLVRKGTGVGGRSVESQDGTSGSSGGGGGGSSSFRARDYSERITSDPAGYAFAALNYYMDFAGTRYNASLTGTNFYHNWSGERTESVTYRVTGFQQGGGNQEEIRPVAYVDTAEYRKLVISDMYPANSDGPYGHTIPSWSVTAKNGYFYNLDKLSGNTNMSDEVDTDAYRYYHNSEFCAGDGGSNSGSFGRSFADEWGVGNSYYYNEGGYTFGDAGDPGDTGNLPRWNGRPGGATIQRISSQVAPNCVITGHPSNVVNIEAGQWWNFTVTDPAFTVYATDSNNAGDVTAFTYQWQLSTDNGNSWSNITGANGQTLRRFSMVYYSDNNHRVRCIVTAINGYGSSTVTSNSATITVTRRQYQTIDPILPYAPSYGTYANISAFETAVTSNNTDWDPSQGNYTIKSAPYTQGANINIGMGKVRLRWNTEIRFWKADGRSGTGCSSGRGLSWDVEARIAIFKLDNAPGQSFNFVHYWDSHGRWTSLDLNRTASSTDYVSANWDFDNTIDLDPAYYYKLVVQFKTSNTQICQCSGGSYINCTSTTSQGDWRFRVMSAGYYSQTKALYPFDTRPGLDGYLRG